MRSKIQAANSSRQAAVNPNALKIQWQACPTAQFNSPCVALNKVLKALAGARLLIYPQVHHDKGVEKLFSIVQNYVLQNSTQKFVGADWASRSSPLNHPPPVLWQISHQAVLKKIRALQTQALHPQTLQPPAWYGLKAADLIKLNIFSSLGLEALIAPRADFYIIDPKLQKAALLYLQARALQAVTIGPAEAKF